MDDGFEHTEWFEVQRANPDACRADEQRAIGRSFSGHPPFDPAAVRRALVAARPHRADGVPDADLHGERGRGRVSAGRRLAEEERTTAECEELHGLGGFPTWEAPDRVDPIVEAFLEEVGSTRVRGTSEA